MYIIFLKEIYKFSVFYKRKRRAMETWSAVCMTFVKLLHLSCLSRLCLSLKFSLKRLESPVCRDVESLAHLRCKVDTLCCIKIKKRALLENKSYTLCLCKIVHSILSLLIDWSLKVVLELLHLLLKALLSLLESCLDFHDLLFLALADSWSP